MSDRESSRRSFLRGGLIGGTCLAAAAIGHAQSDTNDPITPDTDSAIQRGLAYLARSQSPAGSYDDGQEANVAVTGLVGLAMLSGGHHPGRGAYSRTVSRGLDYLLRRGVGSPPGFLHAGSDDSPNQSQMYEHGFGTLFLAELSGTLPTRDRQDRLRTKLEQAVAVIINSQNKDGGWRYLPRPGDADVSVTVAQLMALRAARNAGVTVPKSTVDAAVDYILGCQWPDGGYRYIKGVDAGGSAFARSAAAVVGLLCAGRYDHPAVGRGLDYLRAFKPTSRGGRDPRVERYYYYGHYYAALAFWTAGGDAWTDWFAAVRNDLLARCRTGGANVWTDFSHGTSFATAMACIILQLPNNALPIMEK
jgi:hypothetical protein